ncbi:M20 family metallopeptidase [Pseudomonas sp. LP_7_YM]|uniref:M20 family metallopeptidase n=1 Tax=Pseudomonas sp. LP_7_YM TaxID=2485137 RepID=UPI00141514A1
MKLTTTGKASHAGLEPENGIDACLDLAIKVQKIARTGSTGRKSADQPRGHRRRH